MIVALDDVFRRTCASLVQSDRIFRCRHQFLDCQRCEESGGANKLAGAPTGWNVVAVGAAGRPGLGLQGANEANAVREALADCAKHDSDCHVIAIGPFTVQPN